ncbi:MAG: aspartate aminotransferase family protein [Aestuariivirga sp.]|uniref:aspartate aminotransferase family protein n=1 Tax=Aestuariivirga sp. TaxID=2650926 RepID=UPI0025BC190C|nr:aspartate aminotransferase family protein [Aestuariivirga sp.]MCA3559541.1 aspartate aminotransferase family protein [Aestuariivirga sp.]
MITPVLPTYARAKVAFDRGEGARLFTPEGEAYLDFGSGVAVTSCGHRHPHLLQALIEQANKVWHTSNVYQMPGQEKLARQLIENTFADTVFFTNSGAEALECSIKMARKYHSATGHPERYRLITFEGAFHGRTLATIAAGGQAKYLEGFGPKVDGFDQVAFGDHDALKAAIGPETAGILIEPVQGEGGIRPVPPQCLRGLRELCDAHGILLVLDEVQTGVGRTGKLFAHEWAGITPDIMAIAKGIGGGFPIGACLATERAAVGMTVGTHGSTFAGNPLGTAVASAVLDVILKKGFLEDVQQRALTLKQKLAALKDSHPTIIDEIRGSGLMMGIKCKVPNTALQAAALDQHLLVLGAGDNVVRLLPPLIVSDQDIAEAVDKLDRACKALEAKA